MTLSSRRFSSKKEKAKRQYGDHQHRLRERLGRVLQVRAVVLRSGKKENREGKRRQRESQMLACFFFFFCAAVPSSSSFRRRRPKKESIEKKHQVKTTSPFLPRHPAVLSLSLSQSQSSHYRYKMPRLQARVSFFGAKRNGTGRERGKREKEKEPREAPL